MKNFIFTILALLISHTGNVMAQSINTLEHYDLRPELLDQNDPPNIMVIFDDSGSMRWPIDRDSACADPRFPAWAWSQRNNNACANHTSSRSYLARTGMAQVFDSLVGSVNMGLMVYDWNRRSGDLLQSVTPLTTNRSNNLKRLLGRESDAAIANGTIQSWGGTPIEGSLLVAYDYFVRSSVRNQDNKTGSSVQYVSQGQCPAESAVILVTDGQANSDSRRPHPNGADCRASSTDCSEDMAAYLNAQGVPVYVVGFGSDRLRPFIDGIADAGSDDYDQAFLADSPEQLVSVFNEILGNIFKRASSGSSAAISTSRNQDAGFIVQSSFLPLTEGTPHNGQGTAVDASNPDAITEEVYWAGLSRLLFTDPFGFIRENTNGDKTFDLLDYSADRAIRIEVTDQGKSVYRQLDVTIQEDGTPLETGEGPPLPLLQLKGLWELSESLDELYQRGAPTMSVVDGTIKMPNKDIKQQRSRKNFKTDDKKRMILTNINGEERDFIFRNGGTDENPISESEIGYLGLTKDQTTDAQNLIDWVRGADDNEGAGGLRNRTIFTDTSNGSKAYVRKLLGDTIHSSPVIVGAPSEPFFELYGDTSYQKFRDNTKNKNRRTVAYIASNDGMIHAVNSGRYNPSKRSFSEDIPLGFELWTYIPESVLPHLRFLASNTYSATSHVYGVDGPLVVKDVKVGNSWRTYLFASTGYGGFDHQVDSDVSDNNNSLDTLLKPSVVILDVTDPEEPPIFIDELKDDFGATTVQPAVYHRNGSSFLVVGTGPAAGFKDKQRIDTNAARDAMKGHYSDNSGKIFVYKLTTNGAILQSNISDAIGKVDGFIGDIAAVDWDRKINKNGTYSHDALYFGSNTGSAENDDLSGTLYRFDIAGKTKSEMITSNKNEGSFDNLPFTARNGVFGRDDFEAWVFAGTGRINAQDDFKTTEKNYMYGLLEGVKPNGRLDQRTYRVVDVTGVGVKNNEEGTLVNTPIDGVKNFTDLAKEIKEKRFGWKRESEPSDSPSARIPGRASTPGASILTYINFIPENPDQCSVGGTSELHTVAFATGTVPWSRALAEQAKIKGYPTYGKEIDDAPQDLGNTLVKEVQFLGGGGSGLISAIKELFKHEGTSSNGGTSHRPPNPPTGGGISDPIHPPEEVNYDRYDDGGNVPGFCIGADSTNPPCLGKIPPLTGFGRKSFNEIDYRY